MANRNQEWFPKVGQIPSPYFPGSSTSLCVFAASTAFALNGSVNVVPSYQACHWSM